MNHFTPFVYLLKFLPTGQLYYGSRTAKNCHPSDLWKTYFSSSKTVKKLIAEHGKDSFKYEIRKVFETKAETISWEHRFLKRVNAKKNSNFLNKSNGGKNFGGGPRSLESRVKQSITRNTKTQEEKDKWNTNISSGMSARSQEEKDLTRSKMSAAKHGKTEEAKKLTSVKMSAAKKGKKRAPLSDEIKAKISAANKGKKKSPEHRHNSVMAKKEIRRQKLLKEESAFFKFCKS